MLNLQGVSLYPFAPTPLHMDPKQNTRMEEHKAQGGQSYQYLIEILRPVWKRDKLVAQENTRVATNCQCASSWHLLRPKL